MIIIKKTTQVLAWAFVAMGLWFIGSSGLNAGQLFPPLGEITNGNCATNQLLSWSGGTLNCTDPTPRVTTTPCPNGQYMKQIVNGNPVCVSAASGITTAPCPDGQYMKKIVDGQAVCWPIQRRVCDWSYVTSGSLQLVCPGNRHVAGIAYEGTEWTNATDVHSHPEVDALYCCDY